MVDVVVVSCDDTNSVYYLSPNSLELKKNDKVVFETENGQFMGTVCKETYQEKSKNLVLPLSKVLRIASKDDVEKVKKNTCHTFCGNHATS